MFSDFRQVAKEKLKQQGLTYAQVAANADIEESSIKRFMCGASDSRRVAEIIADALKFKLVYSNGVYTIADESKEAN